MFTMSAATPPPTPSAPRSARAARCPAARAPCRRSNVCGTRCCLLSQRSRHMTTVLNTMMRDTRDVACDDMITQRSRWRSRRSHAVRAVPAGESLPGDTGLASSSRPSIRTSAGIRGVTGDVTGLVSGGAASAGTAAAAAAAPAVSGAPVPMDCSAAAVPASAAALSPSSSYGHTSSCTTIADWAVAACGAAASSSVAGGAGDGCAPGSAVRLRLECHDFTDLSHLLLLAAQLRARCCSRSARACASSSSSSTSTAAKYPAR